MMKHLVGFSLFLINGIVCILGVAWANVTDPNLSMGDSFFWLILGFVFNIIVSFAVQGTADGY